MKYFKATTPNGTTRVRQSATREYITATWCNVLTKEIGEDNQKIPSLTQQFIFGFSESPNPKLDSFWKRGQHGVVEAIEISRKEYIELNK